MKTLDLAQGSPEWKAARAGMVTASRINDVLATVKTGEAAARRDYRAQIVAEILTGTPQDDPFTNAAMQWGTEQEPYARAAYEIATGFIVDQVGFVLHPTIQRAGASPDGLVGVDGLTEIKCPKTATHIGYLVAGTVPKDYQNQMLWQMACSERAWCDFVSFDPRLPDDLQLFKVRFDRDQERIEAMEEEVLKFINECLATVQKLQKVSA